MLDQSRPGPVPFPLQGALRSTSRFVEGEPLPGPHGGKLCRAQLLPARGIFPTCCSDQLSLLQPRTVPHASSRLPSLECIFSSSLPLRVSSSFRIQLRNMWLVVCSSTHQPCFSTMRTCIYAPGVDGVEEGAQVGSGWFSLSFLSCVTGQVTSLSLFSHL